MSLEESGNNISTVTVRLPPPKQLSHVISKHHNNYFKYQKIFICYIIIKNHDFTHSKRHLWSRQSSFLVSDEAGFEELFEEMHSILTSDESLKSELPSDPTSSSFELLPSEVFSDSEVSNDGDGVFISSHFVAILF